MLEAKGYRAIGNGVRLGPPEERGIMLAFSYSDGACDARKIDCPDTFEEACDAELSAWELKRGEKGEREMRRGLCC